MATKLTRVLLLFQGVVFTALGIWFLFDPMPMAEVIQLLPQSPAGLVELRTVYGGLELGLGLLLIGTAFHRPWQEFGLWLLFFCYGGLTVGRLFGILLDQVEDTFTLQLFGFEAGSLLLSGTVLHYRKTVANGSTL